MRKTIPKNRTNRSLIIGILVLSLEIGMLMKLPMNVTSARVLLKISNPVNPSEYFAAIYVWQKTFATELQKKFHQMWEEAEEAEETLSGS